MRIKDKIRLIIRHTEEDAHSKE